MAYVQSLSQVMSPQDLPYVGLSLATESHAFINGILFTAVKKKKKKKKKVLFLWLPILNAAKQSQVGAWMKCNQDYINLPAKEFTKHAQIARQGNVYHTLGPGKMIH